MANAVEEFTVHVSSRGALLRQSGLNADLTPRHLEAAVLTKSDDELWSVELMTISGRLYRVQRLR